MPTSIKLTETVPEHICFSGADTSICGAVCADEDARVVPDDRDPIADSSVHLCPDCANEWARIADDTERKPTVQCACDRMGDGHVWRCGKVVPATIARAMRHPDVDSEFIPVCPDCYDWIRERPTSQIDSPLDDAATWADINQGENHV